MHFVSAGVCVQKVWKMSGDEDGLGRTGSLPECVWLVAFGLMGMHPQA